MQTEIFLALRISSTNHNLNFLLDNTGLIPTKSRNIGDKRISGTIFDFSCIIIESGLSEFDYIQNHTKKLLDDLEPFYERIKKLSQLDGMEVWFSYAIYFDYDDMPCTFFDKSVIEKISCMGASLDIDMYPNIPGDLEKKLG